MQKIVRGPLYYKIFENVTKSHVKKKGYKNKIGMTDHSRSIELF